MESSGRNEPKAVLPRRTCDGAEATAMGAVDPQRAGYMRDVTDLSYGVDLRADERGLFDGGREVSDGGVADAASEVTLSLRRRAEIEHQRACEIERDLSSGRRIIELQSAFMIACDGGGDLRRGTELLESMRAFVASCATCE